MERSGDVIILGGGIIGLTTAYFLAREGLRVVLCDQGKVGMEASWAGAGIIPPSDLAHAEHPLDRLRALSTRLFPQLSLELHERTGIENGYTSCGGLEFLRHSPAADPQEWFGDGVPSEVLAPDRCHELEPALAPDLGPARHLPTMAQLRNPWHLRALRGACEKSGRVTLLEDTAASDWVIEKDRVKGIRAAGEVLRGDHFVVAAGAWTDSLLSELRCRLHITPVRGQIALLNPGARLFRRILISGAQYLVPRGDGRVLAGSTEEHAGFLRTTTAGGIGGLIDLAIRLVPALANAALEKTWAGLRPGSPDGLPFIGSVPGHENVLAAAGHFRAGIQLSAGTALLLSERILGKPPSMPLDAFRLDR